VVDEEACLEGERASSGREEGISFIWPDMAIDDDFGGGI
jgi:hypothetical protein